MSTPDAFSFRPSTFRPGRSYVAAPRGLVSTSQPLATEAGLDALKAGGSALDACIAAALVLGVVEPMSTGLGGDAFALYYEASSGQLSGFNGSGRSGAAATLADAERRGLHGIPAHGPLSVTVPGQIDAFWQLHQRFGRLPWRRLFEAALTYAKDGFPVAPITAGMWADGVALLRRHAPTAEAYLLDGRAPRAGERMRLPALARSLTEIATGGRDAFYEGPLAQELAGHLQAEGGWLQAADFADHRGEWVEPIRLTYRGLEVFELPPNGQGVAALIALGLLAPFELGRLAPNSADALHLIVEALKLAFADARYFVTDPQHEPVPTQGLLDPAYLAVRRASIDPRRAQPAPLPGQPPGWRPSDTVYLCAADGEGNMASLITSIAGSWGSGQVGGRTGIILQNRGASFQLSPKHPNRLAPRKRPFHTIIPAFLAAQGRPCLAFGVMGGDMQPQGHVQFLVNLIDHHYNPQDALDAPRVKVLLDGRLACEPGIADGVARSLAERGHALAPPDGVFFGSGQAALRLPDGTLIGAADHRRDGCAAGY